MKRNTLKKAFYALVACYLVAVVPVTNYTSYETISPSGIMSDKADGF